MPPHRLLEDLVDLGRREPGVEARKRCVDVTDTTTAEYFAKKEDVAPRPLQSSFNLDKIKSAGFQLKDWREELKKYIQENQ